MSWFGKLAGGAFGFLMGGPVGAALGAALGHHFDQAAQEAQAFQAGFEPGEGEHAQHLFFLALFQVMGAIAKSDGRVSEAEIASARAIMDRMQLPDALCRSAMHLFNQGKRQGIRLTEVVSPLIGICERHPHLARLFITLQTEAALADGPLHPAKENHLLELCQDFGFSRYEFFGIRTRLETEQRFGDFREQRRPRARAHYAGGGHDPYEERRNRQSSGDEDLGLGYRPSGLREAYALLGLSARANEKEIKQAYRRAISQHHPDKLAASGATPERLQRATQKSQEIQKAYDAILKARSL